MNAPAHRHSLIPLFPALDGLRGISTIAVLTFHAGMGFPGALLAMTGFFVLSGFLITALLLAEWERDGRLSIVEFLVRRARRLLPAALLTIAFVAVFWNLLPLQTPSDVNPGTRLNDDLFAATFYYYNWRRAYGPAWEGFTALAYPNPPEPSPIAHLWSLAVEEQFYLLFPLIVLGLLVCFRRPIAVAIAGVIGIGAIVLFAPSIGALRGVEGLALLDRIYVGTDVRMGEILCGVLLAVAYSYGGPREVIQQSRVLGWLGFAALLLSTGWWFTMSIGSWWLYDHGFLVIGVLYTFVVAAGLQSSGPVVAILGLPALRWLGERSYGLYLYHFPIQRWVDEMLVDWGEWTLFAVRMGLTVLLATISYSYVEVPLRRGVRPEGRLSLALLGLAVFAGVLAAATIWGTPAHSSWCNPDNPCALSPP